MASSHSKPRSARSVGSIPTARTIPLSMILLRHRTVTLICAALHIPDPKSERDAWIAATAFDAALTLASRNIGNFANMGVRLIDPFEDDAD